MRKGGLPPEPEVNALEQIIEKLADIEAAAARVMSRVPEQKEAYAAKIKEQTEAFDRKQQEETEQAITQIRAELDAQREAELTALREETDRRIEEMRTAFAEKHSFLAEGLARRILEG